MAKKTSVTTKATPSKGNILNDPDIRKKFKSAVAGVTKHFQSIDDAKDLIKEAVDAITDEYGVDKKIVRKLATVMYKQSYASLQAENEHFSELYELIVEGKLNAAADPVEVDDEQ